MSYAQTNYLQIQGRNGGGAPPKYTIAQIGCFVTAFANLTGYDPIVLNAGFRDKMIYTDVDDGILDDLGWGSITAFDPNWEVENTGGGWPQSNNAIVKFIYQSISNPWITVNGKKVANIITHFSKVHDWQNKLIMDSWDGVVKKVGAYGEPVAFAAYRHRVPQPVQPVAPAPTNNGRWGTYERTLPVVKYMKLPPTNMYNLAADSFPEFKVDHQINQYEPVEFVGVLHHKLGTSYYMKSSDFGNADTTGNPTNPLGVNVMDVQDAPPVAPPVAAPVAQLPPDVMEVTVQPGWGITSVLAAAGYSRQSYDREEEWDRVTALNGSPTRLKLQPGQVVKVNRTPLPISEAAPTPAPEASITPEPPANLPEATTIENPAPTPTAAPEKLEQLPYKDDGWKDAIVADKQVVKVEQDAVAFDMDGVGPDIRISKTVYKDGLPSYGTLRHDGVDYYMLKSGKHGDFYAVDKSDLEDDSIFNLSVLDELHDMASELHGKERKAAFLGTMAGLWKFIWSVITLKNK
jgi:hypothetical protein